MDFLLHSIFGKALISLVAFFILSYGLLKGERGTVTRNGRWIGAFFSAAAIFNTPYPFGVSNADILFRMVLAGLMWFVVGYIVGYAWIYFKSKKFQTADNFANSSAEAIKIENQWNSLEHSEEALWEDVYKEFDNGKRQLGLWAKCFSEAAGNENLAKAEYIKQRFEQLKKESLAPNDVELSFSNSQIEAEKVERTPQNKLWLVIALLVICFGLFVYSTSQPENPKKSQAEKIYRKGMVCTLVWDNSSFTELPATRYIDYEYENKMYSSVAYGYGDAPSIRILFPKNYSRKQMETVMQKSEATINGICGK